MVTAISSFSEARIETNIVITTTIVFEGSYTGTVQQLVVRERFENSQMHVVLKPRVTKYEAN